MMLLKRLLLPGKGDLIICILILLNVLLWCAQEEVFNTLKALSQQPVFNKTDPLSMTLALQKGEGGARVIPTPHNYLNKTSARRRPDYNNSLLNSSATSISSGDISSNSSNFLNDVLVTLKWSGGGLHKSGGGGSSTSINDTKSNVVYTNSSIVNAGVALSSKTDSDNGRSSGSNSVTSESHRGSRNDTTSVRNLADVSHGINQNATRRRKKRKPKLLKELTMLNRQNCLSKLLCGVQVARPPTKSSSALNDYAYLVKAFFDRFSIKGIVTDVIDTAFQYEKDGLDLLDDEDGDDEDDDDTSDEKRTKKNKRVKIGNTYIGGAALHKSRTPEYHKYEPKYYEEYERDGDDVDLEYLDLADFEPPAFMQPDVLRKRKGRSFVKAFNETVCGNSTIRGRKRRRKEIPHDINRIRKRRGIQGEVKRGFMGFFNPRFDKTAYLNKRQLEIEKSSNEARQLSIAEEIAARLRSPRQCRLLNWFKEKGNNSPAPAAANNGMTTTITTITNTGGMIGNMNGLQTGLPPAAVSASGNNIGNPGSQVVTVIQQSPVGSATPSSIATPKGAPETPSPAAKAQAMLKNMGQSATNAMEQLSDVATHAASTICPFSINELQELILKAQIAPFPHFFTTTPPSPNFIQSQAFPATKTQAPAAPPITTTTTTTTTTTVKATNPPPQTTTQGNSHGQSRNGLGPPWMGDLVPEPYPTPPRYSSHSMQQSMYGDIPDSTNPTPSRYHIRKPTPPPRYTNRHRPQTSKPQRYQRPNTTPSYSSEYLAQTDDRLDQNDNTNDDLYEDDRFNSYDMNKSPYANHKVHHAPGMRKKKPVPKWMTTTTPSPEDEYPSYSHNDPLPNYSYGIGKEIGYQKPTQQPLRYKSPSKQAQQYGSHKASMREPSSSYKFPNREHLQQEVISKHGKRPQGSPYNININIKEPQYHQQYENQYAEQEHDDIKIGPDFPKETTVAPTPNYIREFQQPPVVVDSKKYPPEIRQGQQQGRPQKSQQNQKEEDSEEDDSDSSDDSDESESAEGESRSNLMGNSGPPPPESRPPPPTAPSPGPYPGPDEESDEDDDKSNEAKEKSEKDAENDDEESEEDSDEDNDGKRSYERNDFSKDRGGPPADFGAVETTAKPRPSEAPVGFFSNFLNSFGTFKNYFQRGKTTPTSQPMAIPKLKTTPKPKPFLHGAAKLTSNKISSGSEEISNDETDSYEDSEEAEEEGKKVTKVKTTSKPKLKSTPKPEVKPKQKINLQMNSKLPQLHPWVNSNKRVQVFLKTTPVPVVIEASSNWPIRAWGEEEDDSVEISDITVDSLEVIKTPNKKNTDVKQNVKKPPSLGLEKFGISASLDKFLSDVRDAHASKTKQTVKTKKKTQPSEEEDDEEDDSYESDEDFSGPPPENRHSPSFRPREPID